MPLNRRHLLAAAGVTAAAYPITQAANAFAAPGDKKPKIPKAKVTTAAQLQAEAGWAALKGQKVGVVTNPTGVLANLTSIVDDMHAQGVNIVGVFGPEHGFRGTAQAGSSEGTSTDPRTGLTVYDTYGANRAKVAGFFAQAGVETVVFDIQDVGARFYTYIWTMYTTMLAAIDTNARFVVLDRPNPVGGRANGPMMTDGNTSGVGAEKIIQQHGMTVGELARMFNERYLPLDADGKRLRELQVIEMKGWKRDMLFADTGLHWVMPSPNMPTSDTALLYPGTAWFEATNLSEGRGTTRPFEIIGAPYVDHRWAQRLNERDLPGVLFRETYFNPTFSKNQGKVCGGVQVHLTDPHSLDAIRTATEMIVALKALYPGFAWRVGDTYAGRWMDLLSGSPRFREQVDSGADAATIIGSWQGELAQWNADRAPFLIY
ncbi:DUF1343 domain-containing protein [Naumannella sp. ID2617S]|nr:DUF1343 domain-containing protein [Naumannella sp. ID2617S]